MSSHTQPNGLGKVVVSPVEFDRLLRMAGAVSDPASVRNNAPFRDAWELSVDATVVSVQAGSDVIQFIVDGPDRALIIPEGHYFHGTVRAIRTVALRDVPILSNAIHVDGYALWLGLRWDGKGDVPEYLLEELYTYLLSQYVQVDPANAEQESVLTLADKVIAKARNLMVTGGVQE